MEYNRQATGISFRRTIAGNPEFASPKRASVPRKRDHHIMVVFRIQRWGEPK
jgi:hypothetical protein